MIVIRWMNESLLLEQFNGGGSFYLSEIIPDRFKVRRISLYNLKFIWIMDNKNLTITFNMYTIIVMFIVFVYMVIVWIHIVMRFHKPEFPCRDIPFLTVSIWFSLMWSERRFNFLPNHIQRRLRLIIVKRGALSANLHPVSTYIWDRGICH